MPREIKMVVEIKPPSFIDWWISRLIYLFNKDAGIMYITKRIKYRISGGSWKSFIEAK